MSESEEDLDYIEIIQTINGRNEFLKNQEQNTELKKRYDEAFSKYWELRNNFLQMKDEFEVNQIQIYKSNTLLADSRNMIRTQMVKLEEFKEKSENLRKKSSDQQIRFETTIQHWNDKINELSNNLEEGPLLIKIKDGQLKVESMLNDIKAIQEKHIEEDYERQPKCTDYNFKGVKQLIWELNEKTKNLEETQKNCTELETEIKQYGSIINDIQKQLHGI